MIFCAAPAKLTFNLFWNNQIFDYLACLYLPCSFTVLSAYRNKHSTCSPAAKPASHLVVHGSEKHQMELPTKPQFTEFTSQPSPCTFCSLLNKLTNLLCSVCFKDEANYIYCTLYNELHKECKPSMVCSNNVKVLDWTFVFSPRFYQETHGYGEENRWREGGEVRK